jgi:hypothetical protein
MAIISGSSEFYRAKSLAAEKTYGIVDTFPLLM